MAEPWSIHVQQAPACHLQGILPRDAWMIYDMLILEWLKVPRCTEILYGIVAMHGNLVIHSYSLQLIPPRPLTWRSCLFESQKQYFQAQHWQSQQVLPSIHTARLRMLDFATEPSVFGNYIRVSEPNTLASIIYFLETLQQHLGCALPWSTQSS